MSQTKVVVTIDEGVLAKLDPAFEKAMADEGLSKDLADLICGSPQS